MSRDRECPDVEMYDDQRDWEAEAVAAKDARITELEAELVFVRGQLEVALGTIKIQRCSVDAILSAVGDDPRVANLRASLVEKTSAPAPTTDRQEG